MYRRKIILRMSMTTGPADGGTTSKTYLDSLPFHPRKFYESLRAAGAPLGWINGILEPGSPVNYDTGNESGIETWSITAEPCLIPGRLQVGHWLTTSDPGADEPDELDEIDLGPGAWDSGPLTVGEYNGLADPAEFPPYRATKIRFIPVNLLYLLP
jgi:hypothetical protein